MTADSATELTLGYYNRNARDFSDSTVDVEFSAVQRKFESLLPAGAAVLDFGCGSGRDALRFLQTGFNVTAVDGSSELCKIAAGLLGIPVRNELFQELDEVEEYDGIWACSSILHLPKSELSDVLIKMKQALKSGGFIYMSFKYGTFEGVRNGRYFTDFTEYDFREFIDTIDGLCIYESWTTNDIRPGREDERWLNLLLKKA